MRRSDLAFADSLRASAGWNQTLADWRRFLRMQPQGCFLAEWNGARAGTATTIVYGPELAWVGMVLVQREYRRRGIGRALLLKCIEHLHALGVRCIKLDATPEGRPVYEALGFKEDWTLRRWEAELSPWASDAADLVVRAWKKSDAPRFDLHDARAFGTSRSKLILALARQSRCALTCESESGSPGGYGLLRPGARASYLGPVAAISPREGIALIEALVSCHRNDRNKYVRGTPTGAGAGRLCWDIPDPNAVATDWAERHGFKAQRSLTRMRLGDDCSRGNPRKQFAIAGPELG
jgi:ribosomal protein S18 acetylase RimI-like enzyme